MVARALTCILTHVYTRTHLHAQSGYIRMH